MANSGKWSDAWAWAEAADVADPLAHLRNRFQIPRGAGGEAVYGCSHSLGLAPRAAAEYVRAVLDTWGEAAVEGHFSGSLPWAEYAVPLERAVARLCGAQPHEVAVMNSLTVNLHLMLATFYRPTRERHQILIERPAFPSDRYAVVSHLGWHGYDPGEALIQVGPRPGEAALRPEDLLEAIGRAGERLALVLLGGVNYYTGQVFDLAACARAAHAVGAMAGFDLAHAIGNVPVALNAGGAGEAANGADFAVWCGYKYLCGGPGAPGGCFVAARHGAAAEPLARLAGWWGNRADTRFEMREAFEPAAGAAGWQVSSPSLLSLAGLRAGLDAYDAAPAAARLRKSQAMVEGFGRWAAALVPGLRSITPASSNGAAPNARGAQWSLDLGAAAMRTQQQLRASGIYSDVRGPILRLSFHPLYNRYADVIATLDALHRCQG